MNHVGTLKRTATTYAFMVGIRCLYSIQKLKITSSCSLLTEQAGAGRCQVYRLLSALNLSQASFNVAKTDALIILCSVVADCGICSVLSVSTCRCFVFIAYLVGMHLSNSLHVVDLDLVGHHKIAHTDLLPPSLRPEHVVQ